MEQQNEQPIESVQSSKNIWITVIAVIVTALVVGGGVYAWQKSNLKSTEQSLQGQISVLQSQISQLQQEQAKQNLPSLNNNQQSMPNQIIPSVNNTPSDNDEVVNNENNNTKNDPLCTNSPTGTDIGRDIYPIDAKYKHIEFLGQIFTAYNCGIDRLNQIFGVDNGIYTLGSTIWLKDYPGENFSQVLQNIDYKCDEVSMGEYHCKKWKLNQNASVDKLMSLEPFADKIEIDDCVNCG